MWFRSFIDGENTSASLESADESLLATARN
jgi:hypothetical protein